MQDLQSASTLRHLPLTTHLLTTHQTKDAGGSRTHGKLLCRQLPDRLASASRCRFQCPRQESNLGLDLRRVACKLHHTPRTHPLTALAQAGVEPAKSRRFELRRFSICVPCLRTSRRLACEAKFRGLESNQRPPGSEPGVTTSSDCPGMGSE